MRTTMIVLAGAMISLAAFGANPLAEERYRMKTGRYTPAEEARQKTLKAAEVERAAVGEASACCRRMNTSFKNGTADPASMEARFRIKFGRNTPAVKAREKAAAAETAMHVQECVELAMCGPMGPEKHAAANSIATLADPERDGRVRMKYGRTTPLDVPRAGGTGDAVASSDRMSCEHECCKHAD